MWIARDIYNSLNESRIKAEAVRDSLIQQNAALSVNLDWLRVRVTELSIERASMLKRYLNIDVPVPSFEQTDSPLDLNRTIDFEDMGDAEALRQGISHNPDGTLSFAKV